MNGDLVMEKKPRKNGDLVMEKKPRKKTGGRKPGSLNKNTLLGKGIAEV